MPLSPSSTLARKLYAGGTLYQSAVVPLRWSAEPSVTWADASRYSIAWRDYGTKGAYPDRFRLNLTEPKPMIMAFSGGEWTH